MGLEGGGSPAALDNCDGRSLACSSSFQGAALTHRSSEAPEGTSKNCGLFSSLSSGLPVGWLVLGDAFRRTLFSLEGNFGPKERLRQSRGEESSCWWLGVGQAGDSLKVTQADKAPSVERLVRASPKARQDARYGRGHKIVWPCGRVAPFTTRTLHSSATPAAVCTLDPERAYTATGGKGSSQQHWLR